MIPLTLDESDPEFEFVKVRRCRDLYETLKQADPQTERRRNVIHVE